MDWLTKTKQKVLARRVAIAVCGKPKPSPRDIGTARKAINQLVDENPKKYLEFHPKYVTPRSDDLIVADTVQTLQSEQLF